MNKWPKFSKGMGYEGKVEDSHDPEGEGQVDEHHQGQQQDEGVQTPFAPSVDADPGRDRR